MRTQLDARVEEWRSVEAREAIPAAHQSFLRIATPERSSALLLHGAGGSPADFQPLADALVAHGISSLCPLLPAHGRGLAALAALRFREPT